MRVTCGLLAWLVVSGIAGAQDTKPDDHWLIVDWEGGTALISPATGEVRPFDQRVPGPYWWPASKPYLVTGSVVIGSAATWQAGSGIEAVAYDAGESVMVLATKAQTLQFVPIDESGGIGEVTEVAWPFACQPLGRLADGSVFGIGTGQRLGQGDRTVPRQHLAQAVDGSPDEQLLVTKDAETFCALVALYEDGTALPPPGMAGTEVWTARPTSDGGFEVLYTVYTKIEGVKRGSSDLQGYRDVYTGTVPASWAEKAVPPAGGKYLWKVPISVKRFGLRIGIDCPPFDAAPRTYDKMERVTIPLMSPTWDRLVWILSSSEKTPLWPSPSFWELTRDGVHQITTLGGPNLTMSPLPDSVYVTVRQSDIEPLETDRKVRRIIRINTSASTWDVIGPPLLGIDHLGIWRLPVPGAPMEKPL